MFRGRGSVMKRGGHTCLITSRDMVTVDIGELYSQTLCFSDVAACKQLRSRLDLCEEDL